MRKMLTEEERKAQCSAFIESNKFGLDTWFTIRVFDENVKNMVLTIALYDKLVKKLDEGLFLNAIPPAEQMLRIKQHIMLDMILKTEIIIESSLIFIYQLSKGYRALPKTMSRYDNKLIKVIKVKVWEKDFPLKTALGLPLISHLHLERDEAKVIASFYEETERSVWETLCKIVNFYDKFETIYNKYKHGLIFRSGSVINDGSGSGSSSFTLEKSALIALDKKSVNDMPKGSILCNIEDILVPGWFNAVSHLNFDENLIKEIFTIIEGVEVVSYVCSNHKTFALNCGQGYLPFRRINDSQIIPFFSPHHRLA